MISPLLLRLMAIPLTILTVFYALLVAGEIFIRVNGSDPAVELMATVNRALTHGFLAWALFALANERDNRKETSS